MRPEMADWESLRRRVEGDVVLPGSPAYQAAPPAFNARFRDVRPAAIVPCASPQDAAEAISFARRHGQELATRAGGHSFAAHSSTRGLLVDVTPMRSVTVAEGVATVGAGARLGEVYQALQDHDLAIPGGTCPPVGVAGLTLGGGLGILGRKYGVTSDHLIGAEVVLADGRILQCDDHREAELFWALRGAGAGNFGVVTSLVFRALPAPPATTNMHLAWPYAQAAAVVGAWQRWAPTAPDELAASLKITAGDDPDRPPAVDLYGAFHGSPADAARLVEELVGHMGADPTAATLTSMTWPRTRSSGRSWATPARSPAGRRSPSRPNTLSLRQVGVLRPPPPGRCRRRAAGGLRGRTDRRGVPRAGLHALGRCLQPPAPRRHRLRPPRPALPAQARRGPGSRRPSGGPGRGPSGGHPVVGIGPPLGLRTGVPELRRSRPGALGRGLLRPELRPAGPGQGTLRPGRPLPVPAVAAPAPVSGSLAARA